MGNTQASTAAGPGDGSKGSAPKLPKQTLVKGRSFMKFGKKKQLLLVDHDGTSTMAIECSSRSDVDTEDGFSHILIDGSTTTPTTTKPPTTPASSSGQGHQYGGLSKSADSLLLAEGGITTRESEFASFETAKSFYDDEGKHRHGNYDETEWPRSVQRF